MKRHFKLVGRWYTSVRLRRLTARAKNMSRGKYTPSFYDYLPVFGMLRADGIDVFALAITNIQLQFLLRRVKILWN